MGLVAVELKVMPASPDVDLNKVKAEIAKIVKVQDANIEPLAFGLKALHIVITAEDRGGGTEPLEKAIKKLPGVGDVEVVTVTLV
jgi:elongation factor 1-beta